MKNYTIKVKQNSDLIYLQTDGSISLRELLIQNNVICDYPCAGRGTCGKCKAKVVSEGNKEILLCKTYPETNMEIELSQVNTIDITYCSKDFDEVTIACDLGTTTIELSVIDKDKKIVARACVLNPQKIFGADVLSRAQACKLYGVKNVREPIIFILNHFIESLKTVNSRVSVKKIYVCANTILTHILAGLSPESLTKYPYVSLFNGTKTITGKDINVDAKELILLPTLESYFGSDALIGLVNTVSNYDNCALYIDLGTNGELALKLGDKYFLTSTSAGPCFEGVNISCGMGGVIGAICAVCDNGDNFDYITIGNKEPIGICGAGLISAISCFLDKGLIDLNGRIFNDNSIKICEKVKITQKDINEFLLAKSAIKSAIEVLLNVANVDKSDIEKVYIAGNLGKYVDIYSLFNSGVLPVEFRDKCVKIDSSAIRGVEEYIINQNLENKINLVKQNKLWVDLSLDDNFNKIFIKNLNIN